VAIWYVDPRIGVGEESDDWIGPFGTGRRRSSWAGVTIANGDTAYGLGGHVGVLTAPIVLDGTGRSVASYGDGRHILDATEMTAGVAAVQSNGANASMQDLIVRGSRHLAQVVRIASSLSNGFTARRIRIEGAGAAHTINDNYGLLSLARNAVTVEDLEVSGTNTGVRISPDLDLAAPQVFRRLRLRDSSVLQANASDGIFFASGVNFGHLLRLEDIEVSGFAENGIDLNQANNVVVDGLYVHSVVKVPGVLGNAIMMGNQSLGGGGCVVRNVKARDVYDGVVFRGGSNNIVRNIDVVAENIALYQGLGTPTGNQVYNATLRAGSVALRTQAGLDLLIRNSVLQSGIDSLGARVDAGMGLDIGHCISNKTVFGGLGSITDSGGNTSNAALMLTPDGRPLPGSPCLTGGAPTYRRDMDRKQSRGHRGAYGAARLT
jgi:hypothetical protein